MGNGVYPEERGAGRPPGNPRGPEPIAMGLIARATEGLSVRARDLTGTACYRNCGVYGYIRIIMKPADDPSARTVKT